ncbi:U2 small nuclear ribonucleoprotein A' [Cladobotryum mycophilum]|uniref:U2 small nuclear ribonucleoprotein A' n=1 Tax=Cladobotryum mycophilum TaxID=491253 RepID=A0ABR0T1L9_9HYPO
MRLTAELIRDSLSYLNPLKERELDLRDPGQLPLSPRITTLLLARNRVASIQPTLSHSVPNLQNLNLASNGLAELADVDILATFPRLTHLVLTENPITKKEIIGKKSKTFDVSSNGSSSMTSKLSRIKLTDDEKTRLQDKIKNATSLQEIIALEKELNEGRLPSGVMYTEGTETMEE